MQDALAPQSPRRVATRRVLDAPVRAAHALLAVGFLGAWLTSELKGFQPVHMAFGYTAAAALVFRLIWAGFGPRSASLSSWWRAARGWPQWWRAAREGQPRLAALSTLGLASTVVALLIGVALATGSGATMHQLGGHHAWGHALEEVHEALGNALLLVVLMHLALIGVLSVMRGRNMAWTMVTGRAPGHGPDRIQRPHVTLAALLCVAVVAGWLWAAPFERVGERLGSVPLTHSDHADGGDDNEAGDDDD